MRVPPPAASLGSLTLAGGGALGSAPCVSRAPPNTGRRTWDPAQTNADLPIGRAALYDRLGRGPGISRSRDDGAQAGAGVRMERLRTHIVITLPP